MDQNTSSEKSSPNSQDQPLTTDTETELTSAAATSSTDHHESSTSEDPSSDNKLSVADCTSSAQSNDEERSLTPPLPPPPPHELQPQQSSQINSGNENSVSPSLDISKSKFDLPTVVGGGLLPTPPQPPITKRPPLLPFPPMRLPMRLQPLRPSILNTPSPSILNNQIRQSQKPGLLPTPPRPAYQKAFASIPTPMPEKLKCPTMDTSSNATLSSKFVPIENQSAKPPETTKAPEVSDSTPTVSSLPPFFRNTLLKDSPEPPTKARKKSHNTEQPNLVPQNFVNPNYGYYPYNYPYQNNGYFPQMYHPGFMTPTGYFHQMSPSTHPTYPMPPPLPASIPQPPLPLDPPKPPPPPPPPVYPTPPSPQPIHTTSPPPSPPLPQQLNPQTLPGMPSQYFQTPPLNPLNQPSSTNFSFSGLITPPPPPPNLAMNNMIPSIPCPQYLGSSEAPTPESPINNIPLPQ